MSSESLANQEFRLIQVYMQMARPSGRGVRVTKNNMGMKNNVDTEEYLTETRKSQKTSLMRHKALKFAFQSLNPIFSTY